MIEYDMITDLKDRFATAGILLKPWMEEALEEICKTNQTQVRLNVKGEPDRHMFSFYLACVLAHFFPGAHILYRSDFDYQKHLKDKIFQDRFAFNMIESSVISMFHYIGNNSDTHTVISCIDFYDKDPQHISTNGYNFIIADVAEHTDEIQETCLKSMITKDIIHPLWWDRRLGSRLIEFDNNSAPAKLNRIGGVL